MIRISRDHIRTRLTIWYVSVLAVILLLYSASASFLLLHNLRKQLFNHAIQDIETVEGLIYFTPDNLLRFRDDYHNHAESKKVLERMLELRSPDGQLLYRNELLGSRSLGDSLLPHEGDGGYSERRAVLPGGERVQVVSRKHSVNGRMVLLRLAYSEEPIWGHFREELAALLLPLPLLLAFAGLGGYLLASRAFRPVQQMARRAEEITGDRLHARLPVQASDGELSDLARVFNKMLSRLEQSFEQLRRFTADASHELRTPLTAIRSVGEVGLRKEASPEEYRDIIGSMLEETNRLTRLVDSLLTISRADAGHTQLHPSTFTAIDLARESISLFEVLLEEKGQRLIVEGDSEASVHGDWLLLRQAVFNIVHNAIKYSPIKGTIRITVRREQQDAVLMEVKDSGPGIGRDHLERVFDRFYRVDSGRSRETGGTGLGLSIAQWTIEAHGGKISVRSKEGEGCTFLIQLPSTDVGRTLEPLSELRETGPVHALYEETNRHLGSGQPLQK